MPSRPTEHIPIPVSHRPSHPSDKIQTPGILVEKLVNMSIFGAEIFLTQIGWDDSIMEEC